jgi:hypothetical protein
MDSDEEYLSNSTDDEVMIDDSGEEGMRTRETPCFSPAPRTDVNVGRGGSRPDAPARSFLCSLQCLAAVHLSLVLTRLSARV